MKKIGDPVEIGDTLAHPQEPGERWARLVGIRNDIKDGIKKYIIREFKPGDKNFPTGEYRTTSSICLCPYPYPFED